jgi:glycosyltransferase involved in cell wall biosynthesis
MTVKTPPVPLVTVVIPCFNYARYLPAAIASVRRQNYENVEILVVDDGSTDDSVEVALTFEVPVIRRVNGGVGAARNTGLAAARGEFVVFLDADDELLPGAIASGAAVLVRQSDAACVVRCCAVMDGEGQPLPTNPPVLQGDDLYSEWLRGNCFAWTPGAVMFRRDRLAALGGFPAHLGPAADYAVYLALARAGGVCFDARDAVRYRQHDGNMSRDRALMLRTTLEVLRRERSLLPPTHVAAFEAGAAAWRAFYGDHMIEGLRASVRARRWGRSERKNLWTLLRYCPTVVFTHVRRKLSLVANGRQVAPVPAPVVPALRGTGDSGG